MKQASFSILLVILLVVVSMGCSPQSTDGLPEGLATSTTPVATGPLHAIASNDLAPGDVRLGGAATEGSPDTTVQPRATASEEPVSTQVQPEDFATSGEQDIAEHLEGTTSKEVVLSGPQPDSEQMTKPMSIAIDAGTAHTCVLTPEGGVKCWGFNGYGQLGDGGTDGASTPINVAGLSSRIVAISSGEVHTCAVTDQGGVKCWGWLELEEPGQRAQDVPGLTSDVRDISSGTGYSCVVTQTGSVMCWGYYHIGQSGDDSTGDRLTVPVTITGLADEVKEVSTGGDHICVVTKTGGIKCWGNNEFGQLGDGTTTYRSAPVDVFGLTSGVRAVSAGNSQTCAVTLDGGVKCWGWVGEGPLGDSPEPNRLTPVDIFPPGSGFIAVTHGVVHTCALNSSGNVKCWGNNEYGQLGNSNNNSMDLLTPVDISGLPEDVVAITAGLEHTCALTSTDKIMCWGGNIVGQLGDGTTNPSFTPVEVVGFGE